ncbi:glycosyltransferase family 2 protein [Campylobacter lari]|nr:glycosyltransferase family 2 protein [Campylobacter lari]
MKKVGVVIPIYNVEKYLKECLDSVINQTYTNLEIILVNDGSTDENSFNIAKEYTLKDKRITLFDKKNGGLSTARNVGIEFFSGEYKLKNKTQTIKENSLIEFNIEGNNPYEIYTIYKSYKAFKNEQDLTNFTYPIIDYIIFLDSDDYWELNCIEECVPRMDGVDVLWFNHIFYYCGIQYDNNRKTLLETYGFDCCMRINSSMLLKKTFNLSIKSFWFAWHGMINFLYLKKIKLKFLNYILHEDHYFGKLLIFQADSIYIYTNKMLYYRIREGSLMNYNNTNMNISESEYKEFDKFDRNIILYKKYHKMSSLFLTSMMICVFLDENNFKWKRNIEKFLFNKIKSQKNILLNIERKYNNLIMSCIFDKYVKLYMENSINKDFSRCFKIFLKHLER